MHTALSYLAFFYESLFLIRALTREKISSCLHLPGLHYPMSGGERCFGVLFFCLKNISLLKHPLIAVLLLCGSWGISLRPYPTGFFHKDNGSSKSQPYCSQARAIQFNSPLQLWYSFQDPSLSISGYKNECLRLQER